MDLTRRCFLRGGAALSGVMVGSCGLRTHASSVGMVSKELRLRIGILSDTHLNNSRIPAQKLKRALETFRKGRVDGVLICGDLTDHGVVPQLKELARIWEEVFPESKGLDGEHVECLFHYGDHDNGGYMHKGDNVLKQYGWTNAERNENTIFYHPKEAWECIFKEPWSPITHKKVKGYDFVLSHHMRERSNDALGLEEFFKGFKPNPDKPFFFSKHRVLRNTVCGPYVWGQDNGKVGRILSSYPNCCAFCGHSHQTAVREDSIWQGAFTAVQVPSLRYVTYESGHDNKPNGYHAEQGMVLNVYDDMMSLRRLDFTNGKLLGPTWDIPLGDKTMPYARETRRRAAPVPEFPADAMLSAAIEETAARGGYSERTLVLEFPVVNGLCGGVRAYDYEITVDAVCFGGDAERIVRRFFSPRCQFAPSAEDSAMKVEIPLARFKKWNALNSRDGGALHVEVRPREIFGGLGRALEADVQS